MCAESACSELGANAGERDIMQRNIFVQELLLSTLTEQLSLVTEGDKDEPSSTLEALPSPGSESEQSSVSVKKQSRNTNEVHIKPQSTQTADKAVGGAAEKPGGQGARPVSAGSHRESSWGHAGSAPTNSSPFQVCGPIMVSSTVAVHGPNLGSSGGVSLMQGRASSAPHGGRERGLNAASAKRSMLKHMPPPRGATDTDPPPH